MPLRHSDYLREFEQLTTERQQLRARLKYIAKRLNAVRSGVHRTRNEIPADVDHDDLENYIAADAGQTAHSSAQTTTTTGQDDAAMPGDFDSLLADMQSN